MSYNNILITEASVQIMHNYCTSYPSKLEEWLWILPEIFNLKHRIWIR